MTPSATTTDGQRLTGSPASYHVHIGPRPDLPRAVYASELGASVEGVPGWVDEATEVDLAVVLDEPHPEVADYQWFSHDDDGYAEIPGATSSTLSTVVDPLDLVAMTMVDESGRVLSAVYVQLHPRPTVPDPPPEVHAHLEPNGRDVRVDWGAPHNGWSEITAFVVTLTSSVGQELTQTIENDPSAWEALFPAVPAGTWTASVRAESVVGSGVSSVATETVVVSVQDPEPTPTPTPTPVPTPTLTPTPVPAQVPASGPMKVEPRVGIRTPGTVRRGAKVTVRIVVRARGEHPSGRVRVEVAGTSRTVRLDQDGTARVAMRIVRSTRPGRKKLVVTYLGDGEVARHEERTTVRVTR